MTRTDADGFSVIDVIRACAQYVPFGQRVRMCPHDDRWFDVGVA